jgi:cytoskeletal protein RodZ
MDDEIVKKLEKRVDRRSFLLGSGLAAAAVLGIAAVSPLTAFAQEQEKRPDENKRAPGKNEKSEKNDKNEQDDSKKDEPAADEKRDENETKLDAEGREYRSCPQCGSNMYRQGRTWTCENCGYSYVE